ncbi:uncharacterized protein [Arachis hypogaea]|uniref:uncharacterized protein n=1 Tax=Arachis hypogaea TaxID=3818 RepID=UPI003B20DEB0
MRSPESLAARTIGSRYFNRRNFLNAGVRFSPSFTWRSIWQAKGVVEIGGCWRIGDGKTIKIWKDPWLPKQNGSRIWSPPKILDPNATVETLIREEEKAWNTDLINQIFAPFEARQIQEIPIPRSEQTDTFIWKKARDGMFRVKLAYHQIKAQNRHQSSNNYEEQREDNTWKELWKTKAHPRTLNFIWRLLHKSLPTKKNLSRKGARCIPTCMRCWEGEETEEHLIRQCDFARRFWFASPLNLRTEQEEGLTLRKWFLDILEKLQLKEKGFFCTLIHQLWKARNQLVFEDKELPIIEEIETATRVFEEYWKAQKKEE